ncbi:heme exporter protein CcmB [bacterium]|nr:heme exporter protein CcmB [bacterium]
MTEIAAAEFKIEWRSPSAWVTSLLFAFLVLLTQALAFPAHLAALPEISFAAFFVSAFFAGILSENARLARDRRSGTPYFLALSAAAPERVFAGKSLAAFAILCLIQCFLFPFLVLFFNLPFAPAWPSALGLCLTANAALACLMTLFGTVTFAWKGVGASLGLPILILPMALPVLAAASIGSSLAWAGEPMVHYLKLLLATDIAVAVVGALSFGKLLGRA